MSDKQENGMSIKVHTHILQAKIDDVIKADHRDYESFSNWADKKSKRAGALICSFIDPGKIDRPAVMAKLDELEVKYKGNASNVTLSELLEAAEAELDAGSTSVDLKEDEDIEEDESPEAEVGFPEDDAPEAEIGHPDDLNVDGLEPDEEDENFSGADEESGD